MIGIRSLSLLGVLAAAPPLAGGCDVQRPGTILAGRPGDSCTVYFRRDALGVAADVPSGPTTGNQNGADVALSGEIVRQNDHWLVLKQDKREFSIPVDSILMLEVTHK